MVTVIANTPVIFTDTSTKKPIHFDWFFGDGTEIWYTKSGVVTHTYAPGTYTASHVSSNKSGVSNKCSQTIVVVEAVPQPVITSEMLMSRIQTFLTASNIINPTLPLIQSQNMDGAVYIYKLPVNPPVYVFTSSAAIDCDGQPCTPCGTDPTNLGDTSFHQSNGQPLAPCILPWYVLPETPNPIFDYANLDIHGGQLGIIISGSKMSYGIFGDERGRDVGNSEGKAIGEVSYAMAVNLGINPDPANGGVSSGVTYIIFTSLLNVVYPIEDISIANLVGNREIQKLYDELETTPPPIPVVPTINMLINSDVPGTKLIVNGTSIILT